MSAFCPVVWPEDPVPECQKGCRECGLFEQGSRMVWGEGNPQAPIMIVLDNPGAREDRDGNAFVCRTRQTLQTTANDVGLGSDDLYMTSILKRRPTRAYEKEKTRQICMTHLIEQMKANKPALVLCLGNVAVQAFFQDLEVDVKSLRGSWHDVRGFQTTVAYHPLAVRRRPNLKASFLEDWTLLAERYKAMG
jgi:DNA polymerase